MYSARWEAGVTSSRERRLSTTNSLHSSPEYPDDVPQADAETVAAALAASYPG